MQTIMSLCTGYGGLDLAVGTVCDTETRWVSDIDPDAVAVQTVRFPHATQLGDLKQVNWGQYTGQVDVVTAGYPCQPFSAAGQRKGTEDERHIWPWIAEAIRVLRPGTVVLENVQGHLRLGFDIVVGDLAAMGRTARWGVVRASDTGAPHRRARLFIVSHLADPDGERSQGAEPAQRCDVPAGGDRPTADPDGTAGDSERINARSSVSEPCKVERFGRRHRMDDATEPVDWQRFGPAIRRWETIMGRSAPAPLVDGTKQLNAKLVEWMMGLPDGWVTDLIPNRRALKTLGNGVVPQQAEMALRMLLT
jgi:DNA (cytosine-5)-methyltransferase 1